MGKKIAVVQSSYIPWKGYFDLINSVDEFILFDDAQYTRRDWRNRNQIKTPDGLKWLTIDVQVKGRFTQKIKETQIAHAGWAELHWKSIGHHYAAARYFKEYQSVFAKLYADCAQEISLSQINYRFIQTLCQILQIKTPIRWSMDYAFEGDSRTERLVNLCQSAGATQYVSGPTAKAYMDESCFKAANINLSYYDYLGYPPYPQLHGPFCHTVTVLDLILNTGPQANRYLKSFFSNGVTHQALARTLD